MQLSSDPHGSNSMSKYLFLKRTIRQTMRGGAVSTPHIVPSHFALTMLAQAQVAKRLLLDTDSESYDMEMEEMDFMRELSHPIMPIAPVADPRAFARDSAALLKHAHGTTTLAFIFKAGAIVAVDSRASQGSYVASQTVKKVIPISPFLLGTMAGGAADCTFWERDLGRTCRLFELKEKRRITVCTASKLLASTVYQYRGYGLSMGTMVAGWDEGTGADLYYVDDDGTRLQGKRFSVGSGSTFAYGVLESYVRDDMTVEEGCDVARRAIYHATHRDAYSGGTCHVYYIGPEGWRKVSADDVSDLHRRYQEEKGLSYNFM